MNLNSEKENAVMCVAAGATLLMFGALCVGAYFISSSGALLLMLVASLVVGFALLYLGAKRFAKYSDIRQTGMQVWGVVTGYKCVKQYYVTEDVLSGDYELYVDTGTLITIMYTAEEPKYKQGDEVSLLFKDGEYYLE